MDRIYPRLSQRNIEDEVLSELEKISRKFDSAFTRNPTELAVARVHEYRKSSTYSRDFGTFDVTTCTGEDGTQIVLVILEGRVALNGKPIRFLQDGHVADWCGDPDPLLQRHYNVAMKVRAERGKKDDKQIHTGHKSLKPAFQRKTEETFIRLHELVNLVCERVIHLEEENAKLKLNRVNSKLWLLKFLRKTPSSIASYTNLEENLYPLLSELAICDERLKTSHDVLQKRVHELERDSLALVWTVTSFCREAILRESEKFVNDRYADLYNRYIQAVGREGKLIDELEHEKEQTKSLEFEMEQLKKEHSALDETSKMLSTGTALQNGDRGENRNTSQSCALKDENERLRSENDILRAKMAKYKQQKEQDGSIIAKMVTMVTEQNTILERQKADADDAVTTQSNLQQANHLSRTQLQFLEDQHESQRLSEERMTVERDTLFKENDYLIEALKNANVERSRLKKKLKKLRAKNRVLNEESQGLRRAADQLVNDNDTESSDDSERLNYDPNDV